MNEMLEKKMEKDLEKLKEKGLEGLNSLMEYVLTKLSDKVKNEDADTNKEVDIYLDISCIYRRLNLDYSEYRMRFGNLIEQHNKQKDRGIYRR